MDVGRHNFLEALGLLRKHIGSASFVAIDLEFTGLGERQASVLDTPSDRYKQARDLAETFPPCQFGLCIYRPAPELPDDASEHYRNAAWEALPFNFTLCPRAVYRSGGARYPMHDVTFSIQASALSFLSAHGFSFAKMFREGIGWLRPNDEARIREENISDYVPEAEEAPVPQKRRDLDSEEIAFLDKTAVRIERWLKDVESMAEIDAEAHNPGTEGDQSKGSEAEANPPAPREKTTHTPSLLIDMAAENDIRWACYEMIRKRFPRVATKPVIAQGGGAMIRLDLLPSSEEAKRRNAMNRAQRKREAIEKRIAESVGFRQVFDLLTASKVPVVAHNAMLDLTKMVACFHQQLPPGLDAFRKLLGSLFPTVIDTKVLLEEACNSYPWLATMQRQAVQRGMTALEGLADRLDNVRVPAKPANDINGSTEIRKSSSSSPRSCTTATSVRCFVNPKDEHCQVTEAFQTYSRAHSAQFQHEAGYDAFVTGRVFLHLCALLAGDSFPSTTNIGHFFSTNDRIRPFANKVYLAQCGGYRWMAVGHEPATNENQFEGRPDVMVISGLPPVKAKDFRAHDMQLRALSDIASQAGAGLRTVGPRTPDGRLLVVLQPLTEKKRKPRNASEDSESQFNGTEQPGGKRAKTEPAGAHRSEGAIEAARDPPRQDGHAPSLTESLANPNLPVEKSKCTSFASLLRERGWHAETYSDVMKKREVSPEHSLG